jgi:hypothetical protein
MSSVFAGPDGGSVLVGSDDLSLLVGPSADGGVLVGSDGTAVLVGPPGVDRRSSQVAVLDGVDGVGGSRIEFDAIKTPAYSTTNSHWWVFVLETSDLAMRHVSVGDSAGTANSWFGRASSGNLAMNSNPGKSFVSGLYGSDGVWNVVQFIDEGDGAGNGLLRAKLNKIARVSSTSYVRAAVYQDYVTFGAFRHSAGPTVALNSAARHAYAALVTGAKPSDAQQDGVVDAFLGTGFLQGLSDELVSLATTLGGTVEWSGKLDGLGSPFVDAGPYGNPSFPNCTFETAVL